MKNLLYNLLDWELFIIVILAAIMASILILVIGIAIVHDAASAAGNKTNSPDNYAPEPYAAWAHQCAEAGGEWVLVVSEDTVEFHCMVD